MRRIGVLALQGDFECHRALLERMGVASSPVRTPEELDGLGGLIIPGGESTTIGMLMERWGLLQPLRRRAAHGMPLLGTCAGAILLAATIRSGSQPGLNLMDIDIARNAYGRQRESFEAEPHCTKEAPAELCGGNTPLSGLFIRAPVIVRTGTDVVVLALFEGRPVVVRQGNVVAATFHPELVGETRLHSYFLGVVAAARPAD